MKSNQAIAHQKQDKRLMVADRKSKRREEILRTCRFRDDKEKKDIARFLAEHNFLVPLVLEALANLRQTFGEGAVPVLSLVIDPEDEDFEELFISIITDKPTDEALDLLDQFDEEWFVDVLPETKNRLNVTIETKYAI